MKKIILNSRGRHYLQRVGIFLVMLALIVGIPGCEPTSCGSVLRYALSILSTLGGTVNVLSDGTSPYPNGVVVTLVAIPDAGYRFVQWTGDVEGVDDVTSPTITITMNAARRVTANFALLGYSLTVDSTDGGDVTSPGEGTFTYNASMVVDLVATPAIGYRFVNWTGNVVTIANVNAASTTITIQGNYAITANFIAQYDLAIDSTVGGEVITPSEGTFTYDVGTVVDLVAEAEEGYYFVQWTGNVSAIADVYAATTTIIMNGDYSITANFEQIPPEQFTLTISSTAGGSVTTPGNGVFAYDAGTVVDLLAAPASGYRFVEWTGNVDTIAGVEDAITTIAMNGDYSITANFEQIPPEQFTLTISSTAGGSVTTPGNGIFAYDEGATVNLAAKADEGYRFLKWTGNVSTISDVNAATTTITMNGDYSITANFIAQYDLTIDSTDGGEVITPSEGTFTYDAGTVVSLVAEAGESYYFVQWTGNVDTIADVEDAITTVTINDDYTITANFALPIWDWYDLDAIRDNLGGSYILMNDLDSTTAGYKELASATANRRKGWQPIGTAAEGAKFAGSFDGQGYEICDLFIDRPAKSNVGLFSVVSEGGVIENVGLMDVTVTGCSGVGGLVGTNEGPISNSYCTGRVIGYSVVGGLVGYNSGNVSSSYCTGRVTGGWWVGGLAGHNSGNVNNSYCTGIVTGGWWVGGLAGHNSGNVNNSYCTGVVIGGWWVGGLAGHNSGNVNNSYCTGRVTGYGSVGGLVGKNEGSVNNSYSSGSVTGNTCVGGLTGHNNGNVSNSYSTGIVTGYSYVGGLVGWNEGTVTDSYSTGSVTGSNNVGGLVGKNEGPVSNSYSTGSVTGNTHVGGLVGRNEDTVSNSFWDFPTSGQATSDGGTGKTTAEMQDITTFSGAAWDIIAVDDADDRNTGYIWNIVDDVTYPFLSWQPV